MAEVARGRAAESLISTRSPDAVAADSRCPTCGQAVPPELADRAQTELDEALLNQVSAALRAESAVSRQTAEQRVETARRLYEEAVALHDRLRGQTWTVSERLPRDRTCPALARGLLREHAREHLSRRELEDAMVITSELATNAYVHGEGTIELTLTRGEDRLRIEVLDEGHPARIAVVRPDERQAGGRGLLIVEQLASDWGTVAGSGQVWAELPIEGGGP
jgi:anti-sigma regulatory factor (Ser/Thr protein kinase)